jgi:hypothetical protein
MAVAAPGQKFIVQSKGTAVEGVMWFIEAVVFGGVAGTIAYALAYCVMITAAGGDVAGHVGGDAAEREWWERNEGIWRAWKRERYGPD